MCAPGQRFPERLTVAAPKTSAVAAGSHGERLSAPEGGARRSCAPHRGASRVSSRNATMMPSDGRRRASEWPRDSQTESAGYLAGMNARVVSLACVHLRILKAASHGSRRRARSCHYRIAGRDPSAKRRRGSGGCVNRRNEEIAALVPSPSAAGRHLAPILSGPQRRWGVLAPRVRKGQAVAITRGMAAAANATRLRAGLFTGLSK